MGLRVHTLAAISYWILGGGLSFGHACFSRMLPPLPNCKHQKALAASQPLWGSADLPSRHRAPHAFFLLALRARRLVGN